MSAGGVGKGPVTYEDIAAPSRLGGQWSRLPGLTLGALRVAWQASPRNLLATFAVQVLAGVTLAVQLLAAREVLNKLIEVAGGTASAADLAPSFALLIGAIVMFGALNAVTDALQRVLAELVAQHTFENIISVSTAVRLEAFETPGFYDQLERARASATYRSIEMVNSVSSFSMGLLASLGIAAALFIIEPLLVPFIALSAVPLFITTVFNSRQAYTFEYAMTPENRERAYLIELLTGRETAKEIRVFGAEGFLRTRYRVLTAERLRRLRQFAKERLQVAMVGTVGSAMGVGLALATLAWLLSRGRIDISSAVTAGAAMQQLSARMAGMIGSVGKLIESGMFVDDYNAFLELVPELPAEAESSSERRPSPRFTGLAVEDVSFTYPSTERRVLDKVSMRVDPGEVVALVGENGSGKTTLVKLICQLYQPQAGRVLWNGLHADDLTPEDIRDDMTVIFQDFIQYHLSAIDNIALGRVEREPRLEDIRQAARQSGADPFLSRLPEGYETRLGRQFFGGHELSIGQWQRLALARAFFRGGNFLVLDEPTASLDPRAEYELFQQMRRLAEGRSVLLVSHRFSSVRSADRIYVLQHGQITEAGSHDELMARGGHYAELFELQAGAYLGGNGRNGRKNPEIAGVSRV
jgi:ATP-binding cassette, subfamily B, bacterial